MDLSGRGLEAAKETALQTGKSVCKSPETGACWGVQERATEAVLPEGAGLDQWVRKVTRSGRTLERRKTSGSGACGLVFFGRGFVLWSWALNPGLAHAE